MFVARRINAKCLIIIDERICSLYNFDNCSQGAKGFAGEPGIPGESGDPGRPVSVTQTFHLFADIRG